MEEGETMEGDMEEDIEFLLEDMDYIPGHFHLELNLNCDPAGPMKLRVRDTHLKQESLRGELEAEDGYLQYAVRNLLGLLAFHLEQLDAAEETFRLLTSSWTDVSLFFKKSGRVRGFARRDTAIWMCRCYKYTMQTEKEKAE